MLSFMSYMELVASVINLCLIDYVDSANCMLPNDVIQLKTWCCVCIILILQLFGCSEGQGELCRAQYHIMFITYFSKLLSDYTRVIVHFHI